MTTFYSNKVRGFFPADMQAAYEAAGTWPADGIAVTPEDETVLREAIAAGATIRKKSGGKWDISAPPPPPFAVQAAPYLASVRQRRGAILNRLAGIGFAAMADGDTDTASGVRAPARRRADSSISKATRARPKCWPTPSPRRISRTSTCPCIRPWCAICWKASTPSSAT
jgi:hypothetical protein